MINKKIKDLRDNFKNYNIDGYIVPKNDEFFSEHSSKDRLKIISNFTGSAGYAIILKKKTYLFVDGRYTIQAKIESGNNFEIIAYEKLFNCNLFKDLKLGIDPRLFTSYLLRKTISKYNKIVLIKENLIDSILKTKKIASKPFYSLNNKFIGESHIKKINKITNFLKKNNLDYLFVTAPENVAWLLNIRGFDSPTSPVPNSHLILSKKKDIFLIAKKKNLIKLIKEKKIKKKEIIEPSKLEKFLINIKGENILIDEKTCSIYYEKIINQKLKIVRKDDPIYLLKSIKNKTEINNMIDAHIIDGVALTKFIYWMKRINTKSITEVYAQNKLEKFRKKNEKYLFPSFNTIAGSGGNGAIVHYRATKKKEKYIKKNEIFLCDSGGQYKYGTTDVTRTICFSNHNLDIKKIFTNVLKGHIAVANVNLDKKGYGKLIDIEARKPLKDIGLGYNHGTGHGVGHFLNVHEGPQAISKYNLIKLQEGMILSNEPGFYQKGKFGIRIENLIYVKKSREKLFFKNLTLAPIEKDLIDFSLLTNVEKNYLFKYHLEVYSKISPFLNKNEKSWLASLI